MAVYRVGANSYASRSASGRSSSATGGLPNTAGYGQAFISKVVRHDRPRSNDGTEVIFVEEVAGPPPSTDLGGFGVLIG